MLTSKAPCVYLCWTSDDIALLFPFYSSLPGDHQLLKGKRYVLTLPLAKCLVYKTYILDIVLINHYLFMRDRITVMNFLIVIQFSHEKFQGQLIFFMNILNARMLL